MALNITLRHLASFKNQKLGEHTMKVHELTEEEREQMYEEMFKKMKIERKHLSKEELEKKIIDYLSKKQPCSLATTTNVNNYTSLYLRTYVLPEFCTK